MERVFDASHPDPLEIEKAKKVLKVSEAIIYFAELLFLLLVICVIRFNYLAMQEHEQALTEALARLADISDGESGIKMLPTLLYFFFLHLMSTSKIYSPTC